MGNDGLTVRDIMVANVRTVFPETPALRAAEVMARSRIRHLVVTDADGKVLGVFTQRDVLKHLSPWLSKVASAPQEPPRCEVRDLMSTPPITIAPDALAQEAAAILASKAVGCLPVVDDEGLLVGVLSSTDLLTSVACNQLPTALDKFERFIPPALISDTGNIHLPRGYGGELKFDTAVLSYAKATKRIGLKLFLKGKDDESLNGARRVNLTDEHVVVPAKDFLDYHRIMFRGELDVTEDERNHYFILSPRLPKLKARAAPPRKHSGFPDRRR